MRSSPGGLALKTSRFAAAALVVLAAACDPLTTPVPGKGYGGEPPVGTPIVLDPAAELDVDGDLAGDGWWWVPFDGETAPEEVATCADGSTTGLAISPGTSDDLLVFFDGGGACWSYETCILGTAVDRDYDVEKFKAEARDFVPCSLTSRALLPPALAGATVVFVPYCTGDVHGGDRVRDYGNSVFHETWQHRGHANVRAYLRRLAATYAPARLVVAGSSAGGFGALVNYELFRWTWPDARAYLVDDSGPALAGDEVPPQFRDNWYSAWNIGAALDPWCPGCRADLSAAFTVLADLHPDDRLALVSHEEDVVMSLFMLETGAGFSAALGALEQAVLRPSGVRAFLDAGSEHMLLTPLTACEVGSYVADHAAGGVGLDAWLEQMLSDDPAWSTRVD
jgi:hypothetical protein